MALFGAAALGPIYVLVKKKGFFLDARAFVPAGEDVTPTPLTLATPFTPLADLLQD